MYANRADNYDQPKPSELRTGNIVMQSSTFLMVENVFPDYYEATPLLGDKTLIERYSYDLVLGVDLKAWIYNHELKRVVDVLMKYNGFIKTNPIPFNPCYSNGEFELKSAGEWYCNGTPVSYLHEVQNLYSNTGKDLVVIGAF